MNTFKKQNYISQFYRIGTISGILYYRPQYKTRRIAIYGRGAPLPPDGGKMSDAPVIMDYDTDLFVPDYIGYGRSDGDFRPMNCVKTFLALFDAFSKGTTAVCHYEGITKKLKYEEIYLLGASFGGAYVPLLPRFNPKIKNICAIFPVVEWATIGKKQPEETIEGFIKAMTGDGYKHLYRGILHASWKKHFSGKDGLSPIDNIQFLSKASVFIAHGKKDININYSNSVNYYKKLTTLYPKQKEQFKLKLYPYNHGDETSKRAIIDYFAWKEVPKNRGK